MATLLLWASVLLRAIRWKWLFKVRELPSISSLYKAELIGYFGNNILPLRLGELLRSYFIGEEYKLSKSYVFGTIIMERLMDLVALAAFAILLLLWYPLGEIINTYNHYHSAGRKNKIT